MSGDGTWKGPSLPVAMWRAFKRFWSCWWISTRMDWFKPSGVPWWCYVLQATISGPAFGLYQAAGQFMARGWPRWAWRWMLWPEERLLDAEFYWWVESHITGWRMVPIKPMQSWTGPSDKPPMTPMRTRVRRDLYDPDNPTRAFMAVTGAQIVTKGGTPVDSMYQPIDDS